MTASRRALAAALAALAALAATASGTSLPDRTFRVSVSPSLGDLDGDSGDTSLSANGLIIAFASTASGFADDPNGATRDVFTFDVATGERRLVSSAPGGASGPSSSPVLSADGQTVAFVSAAPNLDEGDANGVTDIFVRTKDGPITRVSVAPGGGDANGPSSEPDISADGRYVAFTSSATNLVAGDTNAQPDVFVRDLRAGTTARVSIGHGGAQAAGASGAPAIAAGGRVVSFASSAANLVARDRNGVADVFTRDLARGRTGLVSVSSRERAQNAAVASPFDQVSDLSADGRYVVFDSDATNLVRADANRRTDVFLRDRRKRTTVLVSASSLNVQGNNDSFSPLITPSGRFVAFQSFATNMALGDGPREDVFVRDLRRRTTSVVGVTHDGAARGPELVAQLLQRPALSSDGRIAAFSSTAENLVAGDANRHEDVFVRLMDAPQGELAARVLPRKRPVVELTADDPAATEFVCRVDRGRPFRCVRGRTRMPRLRGGRHHLSVRAGGPGMLYDPQALDVPFLVDRKGPRVSIGGLRSPLRTIRGRARDPAGVERVLVAVTYFHGGCRALARKRFRKAPCSARVFQPAKGGRRWSLRLPEAIRGPVVIYTRAIDRGGNASPVRTRKAVVR